MPCNEKLVDIFPQRLSQNLCMFALPPLLLTNVIKVFLLIMYYFYQKSCVTNGHLLLRRSLFPFTKALTHKTQWKCAKYYCWHFSSWLLPIEDNDLGNWWAGRLHLWYSFKAGEGTEEVAPMGRVNISLVQFFSILAVFLTTLVDISFKMICQVRRLLIVDTVYYNYGIL